MRNMPYIVVRSHMSRKKSNRSLIRQCTTPTQCIVSVFLVTALGAMLVQIQYYTKIGLGDASNWRYSVMNNLLFNSSSITYATSLVARVGSIDQLRWPSDDFNGSTPSNMSSLNSPRPIKNVDTNHLLPPDFLVLATTFSSAPHKAPIYEYTLNLWSKLLPYVQPVLFFDESLSTSLVEMAMNLHWKVVRLPQTAEPSHASRQLPPVLKALFAELIAKFPTAGFYGFANGDIVFTNSLLQTLQYVDDVATALNWTSLFITGGRTSLNILNLVEKTNNVSASEVQLDDIEALTQKATKKDRNLGAEDFFITRNFPWSTIPPFVVGRVGYDNWLVARAVTSQSIATVDITQTAVAVHLTDSDGDRAGHKASIDHSFNLQLAGGVMFDSRLGATHCIPFYTKANNSPSPNLSNASSSNRNFNSKMSMYLRDATHDSNCRASFDRLSWKTTPTKFVQAWTEMCRSVCIRPESSTRNKIVKSHARKPRRGPIVKRWVKKT